MTMEKLKLYKSLPLDFQLTPENAIEKRLEWVSEVYYTNEKPLKCFRHLSYLLKYRGYKLGMPASPSSLSFNHFGWYAPID